MYMSIAFQYASLGYDPATIDNDQLPARRAWFDRLLLPPFRSGPRSGDADVREPHLFADGDTFVTNHELFNWIVLRVDPKFFSIYEASRYRAFLTLDSCDIPRMALTVVDVPASSVRLEATIQCTSTDFPITATTGFRLEDDFVIGMASDTDNGDPVPEQVKLLWVLSRAKSYC